MSSNDAWRYILESKPKYKSSWQPKSIIKRAQNVTLSPEDEVFWTSPYAGDNTLFKQVNSNNAKIPVLQPLTNHQQNKLLNKLKGVTSI